jgi:hypothetical protein
MKIFTTVCGLIVLNCALQEPLYGHRLGVNEPKHSVALPHQRPVHSRALPTSALVNGKFSWVRIAGHSPAVNAATRLSSRLEVQELSDAKISNPYSVNQRSAANQTAAAFFPPPGDASVFKPVAAIGL